MLENTGPLHSACHRSNCRSKSALQVKWVTAYLVGPHTVANIVTNARVLYVTLTACPDIISIVDLLMGVFEVYVSTGADRLLACIA